MLKQEGRKPGLPKLTKQNMESAPEETWVEAVKTTVNVAVEEIDHIRSIDGGIKLLENANVELVDLEVQVPDPWTTVTTFANSWIAGPRLNRYRKGPDGVVEILVSITDGTAGNAAFTLPVGYRPHQVLIKSAWDTTTPLARRIDINTTGTVVPQTGTVAHELHTSFLAIESSPVPLSCWPKFVKTKFVNVAAVVIAGVYDGATTLPLPAGAAYAPVWESSSQGGFPQVKIVNIAGLPYNRKSRVSLLIFGK